MGAQINSVTDSNCWSLCTDVTYTEPEMCQVHWIEGSVRISSVLQKTASVHSCEGTYKKYFLTYSDTRKCIRVFTYITVNACHCCFN